MTIKYLEDGLKFAKVPDGYEAAAGEVLFPDVPTTAELEAAFPGYAAAVAAQEAAATRQPILAQLADLDPLMPRGVEELIELLISKNVIAQTDLSSEAQARLSQKATLRAQLAAVK